MAEIPDVNPLKPIWPVRPDERGRGQRQRDRNEERDKGEPEKPLPERKPGSDDGHQIDEYV